MNIAVFINRNNVRISRIKCYCFICSHSRSKEYIQFLGIAFGNINIFLFKNNIRYNVNIKKRKLIFFSEILCSTVGETVYFYILLRISTSKNIVVNICFPVEYIHFFQIVATIKDITFNACYTIRNSYTFQA